ncbi:MAG: hypothetical protein ACTS6J_24690 [Burkholderiales bacterium]
MDTDVHWTAIEESKWVTLSRSSGTTTQRTTPVPVFSGSFPIFLQRAKGSLGFSRMGQMRRQGRFVAGVVVALSMAACVKCPSGIPRPAESRSPVSEQRPTGGLHPPTAEERAKIDQELINTGEVRPNCLGLERINAERALQGLPPLKIEPVPDGQEVAPLPLHDCSPALRV